MRFNRFAAGVLFAALAFVPTFAAEDGVKEQFDTIKEAITKERQEAIKAFQEAKNGAEKQSAMERLQKPPAELKKLLPLIEKEPKGELGFEMLSYAVGMRLENVKIYDLLAQHHASSDKIAILCQRLSGNPPDESEKLLRTVLEKNEDTDAKGMAMLALANLLHNQAEKKGKVAADKEALALFQKIQSDFADVKIGKSTLGAQTKGMITEIKTLGVGMKAPEAVSRDLDDKEVKLADYKGKVVVLDIWATWCGPCRAMIPHEREMVKHFEKQPFALVSISADEKKETLTEFLENEKMPWTHWWAGRSGDVLKTFNVRFFPTIYVIDANGVIRYKNIRGEQLEKAVAELLKETEKK